MSLELTHLERLTNQPEDGLLTEKETTLVIEKIGSDEYIDIVRNIVTYLCSQENPTNFGVREIFYVTHMGNIVDALNKTNIIVAQIIEESCNKTSQDNLPSYAVIAFALNTLLVNMADTGDIRNISAIEKAEKYRTRVYIRGEEKTRSKSYKGIGKPEALREALKNRQTLLEEKKIADDRSDRAERKEQARLGLIEKGVLIPVGDNSEDFKVKYIKLRGSYQWSSQRFMLNISGFSRKRSISKYGGAEAFSQIIDELADFLKLSPLEKRILKEKEYGKLSHYRESESKK